MCGRLFQGLQKRIKRARRKHVHFIDNKNFVFPCNRGILHLFPKVAHFVHAVVRCGVDFADIEIRRILECFTAFAFSTRRTVHGGIAVDCRRKNFRYTRFPRSARTAKEVCMSNSTRIDLIFQDGNDMFLSHDVV